MNVQQVIIKGIKELLFSHNYLVLPDFGGFVLKSKPAHFSASGGSLFPPGKTVSFNAQLKQNDGILSLWLQNKIQCSSQEALAHLKDFSGFCSGVLVAKRRLNLDGLGFFFIDFENNICFEPQQDSNFLSDSFGLLPISIKPLEAEVREPAKDTVFVDRRLSSEQIKTKHPLRRGRTMRRLINSIVLVSLSVSLLFLIMSRSGSNGMMYASLFNEETAGHYVPLNYPALGLETSQTASQAYVADANGIASISLAPNKVLAVKVFEKAEALVSNEEVHSQERYEIVLGCFNVLSNAQRMNKQLISQNIHSRISSKNAKGMYVISDGRYSSKEEAVEHLQQLKAAFPKAWIKKGD